MGFPCSAVPLLQDRQDDHDFIFPGQRSAIAPASVAGFCDSNSIDRNYLCFSLPAEALAQAGSTAAYIEPPGMPVLRCMAEFLACRGFV
jgi:hypothetical protein